MKIIINLFNTFGFFKCGFSKPLFSFKPIIIFSNFNPKKKDWDQTIHNYWSPLLLELKTVIKPSEQLFVQPQVLPIKVKRNSKFNGLFELRRDHDKIERKGDFSVIKAKQFKHKIEVLNEIEDICIDDLPTVYSEYEQSEFSDWEESITGSLSNSRFSSI